MNDRSIKTIDDVILILDNIILETETTNNPLGYFAVLYQKVTIKVKEGISQNFFDDALRMEKLDIIFAKRYIDAYYSWKAKKAITQAWEKALVLSTSNSTLVFQHLLIGMNAHINLDLGIAAASISTKENIQELQSDFNKINEILSSLVDEVQFGLSAVWPLLKWILSKLGKIDNYLVDFSMQIARDGAWSFATSLIHCNTTEQPAQIERRDAKVSNKSAIITQPGKWVQLLFWIILLGERGSVSEKMNKLKSVKTENLAPRI